MDSCGILSVQNFGRLFMKIIQSIFYLIKRHKDPPYKRSSEELLKYTGNNLKKPSPVNIDNVIDNAKLNDSWTANSNLAFWKNLLENYEIPHWGEQARKDKTYERYFKALCLGVFHYEYLVEASSATMIDYYEQASDYAVDLLCPRKQLLKLMNKTIPIPEIARTFDVPIDVAKRAIYKALLELKK